MSDTIMCEKTELENFLKNLQTGLKKYSLKELNDSLYIVLRNRNGKQHPKQKHIKVVLEEVAKEFDIQLEYLINSRKRGNVQQARKIAYCVLHFNLKLPIRYIAKNIFYQTWHTRVGNIIQYHNRLDLNIKPDKEFYEKLQKINEKVTDKFKNI